MNLFDYLFENTFHKKKHLILGVSESLSYQMAFDKASQLARILQQKIGTGKNIVLVSPNSSFFLISYLAIIKSGNVCVPLNNSIEQKNLDYILKKTKCDFVFVSKIVLKKLIFSITVFTEDNLKLLEFDSAIERKVKFEDFDGEQLAEIIFTSGSTSTPKGVMLTHNNIIANTSSIIQYLNLNNSEIALVVLPFFYCYGLSVLHTHIRVGGQLVLNNNFIFLTSTINNINKYNCTSFAGVPSHFQLLLRKTDLFKKTKFPSLRYVTQAGGKLPNVIIKEFVASFPNIMFYVMYGQTEATARLSFLSPDLVLDKLGSLGKGIPDVEIKVVNSKNQRVLPGETGEIIAKGNNVMLGYFEDQEETDKVIKNGWLYTGDMATIDNEGYIYLTARKKEIIKIGGKRISPKEIEEVILMIPGVIDCTIEPFEDEILEQAIKATVYISEKFVSIINDEFIKKNCAEKLSKYKVPSIIDVRSNFSQSLTGKKMIKTN